MHHIVGSPGTSFRISDAEIFLHAGIDASGISERSTSFCSVDKTEPEIQEPGIKRLSSMRSAAKHLKVILRWPLRKEKKSAGGLNELDDDASSVDSVKSWSHVETTPTPLRQRYSKMSSLFGNKRSFATKGTPSSSTKMRSVASFTQGVMQPESPPASASWSSSSFVDKIEAVHLEKDEPSPSPSGVSRHIPKKYGSLNSRLMNQYLGSKAQGLTLDESTSRAPSSRMSRRSLLSVA
jgi:hypothetical protein